MTAIDSAIAMAVPMVRPWAGGGGGYLGRCVREPPVGGKWRGSAASVAIQKYQGKGDQSGSRFCKNWSRPSTASSVR